MPERVSQAEFARRMGVNKSTVTRWVQNGRITLAADGRVDVDQASRERDASESPMPHHQARKAQIDSQKAQLPAQPAQPADPMPGAGQVEKLGAALKIETLKLQRAKREMAELDLDRLAGALVERETVDRVLDEIGRAMRRLLQNMPDRLAGTIAAHAGNAAAIRKTLNEGAHDMAHEVADLLERKIEDLSE